MAINPGGVLVIPHGVVPVWNLNGVLIVFSTQNLSVFFFLFSLTNMAWAKTILDEKKACEVEENEYKIILFELQRCLKTGILKVERL